MESIINSQGTACFEKRLNFCEKNKDKANSLFRILAITTVTKAQNLTLKNSILKVFN